MKHPIVFNFNNQSYPRGWGPLVVIAMTLLAIAIFVFGFISLLIIGLYRLLCAMIDMIIAPFTKSAKQSKHAVKTPSSKPGAPSSTMIDMDKDDQGTFRPR